MAEDLIILSSVTHAYTRAGMELLVLDEFTMSIEEGTFLALMGPSGSGKTTLLNLIGGLDRPTTGLIQIGGVELAGLSESELARWRADNVGFVFQGFNLLPVLTALENVMLPLLLAPLSGKERRKHAELALELVGLADRMHHRPKQLSGGQEQRVAIARAIATDPRLILADEPTGDLDRESADSVLELLGTLNREHNKTIVMVTHDPLAAAYARASAHLDKGKLGRVVQHEPRIATGSA